MKKFILAVTIALAFVSVNSAFTQTSGVLWLKSFSPGSSDLNDPLIDRTTLAVLDSLMQDESINVTFLGAADSLRWKLDGQTVHYYISEAWNDAKRLGRARALKARYGRGTIGITHEDVAGVKVVWSKDSTPEHYMRTLEEQNKDLTREMAKLKNTVNSLKPTLARNGANGKNGTNAHINWRLQGGVWTWQAGSNGNLLSPSLALSIVINHTSFIIQGGVTPWHKSTHLGNQSNSFVYAGIKHMKTDIFGITLGGFRGWEFFTSTDDWSFKTTGLAAGVVFVYKKIEFNPTLTFSNILTLEKAARWKVGSTIGVNFNFN